MSVGRRPGTRTQLTDADLVVLGVLTNGPNHGHGMWCQLAECDIQDWAEVSRAQVYYSLGKLAERNMIRSVSEHAASGGRERQTWEITKEGRQALKATLASIHWIRSRRVQPFMTWVGWSSLAGAATRRKIISARQEFIESEIAREQETLSTIQSAATNTPGATVTISMVGYAIRQLQLELDWLEELGGVFEK